MALAWEVSWMRFTQVSGRPAVFRPARRAVTMALALRQALRPERRMHTLPLFRHNAAASLVTLGRLS